MARCSKCNEVYSEFYLIDSVCEDCISIQNKSQEIKNNNDSLMEAKIISYDSVNGKGILITKENEKKDFSIDNWSYFETLPEIGLIVEIDDNGNLIPKKDFNKEKLSKLKIIIDNYINDSVVNGLKVVNNSESGFVLEEKSFSFLYCIILLIIFSILFGLLVGIFAPIIALPFSIWFAITRKTFKGVISYDKFEVDVYKKDRFYKKLTLKNDQNK